MSDPRLAPAAGQKRSAAQSIRPSYAQHSHVPPPPPPPSAPHPHLVSSSFSASSSASCQSHARASHHQQPSAQQLQAQHRPQPPAEKKRAVSVHHNGSGHARRHSGNSSRYDDDDGSEQMDCSVRWERKDAQPLQTDSRRQQHPAATVLHKQQPQQPQLQHGSEVDAGCGAEEAVVALNPATASLHVPHSWSEIVQKDKRRMPAAAPAAASSSSTSSRPPARAPIVLQPQGKPSTSSHTTTSSSSSSSSKPVQRSPLSAAYFACLVPADKEQQKHQERAARHHHDIGCHRDAVISVLSCILEQLFPNRDADVLPVDPALITMFHTERVPSISISCYLSRLAQYTECSSEVLIQSIIHINRILHHRPAFKINSLNIHRLLLTSLLCSAKFFDDQYYNNHFYAKVGGISNRELNELEIEFLALINFDLFVDFSVYRHFYAELGGDKLHQHCSCRYKEMPLFDADMYRMPKECQGAEDWSGEDDKAETELETADDRDALDKARGSRYGAEEVKTTIGRHTPVQSSAAAGVPSSVSPSTTASSSDSDNDDDDATPIESDDELDDAAAVNDKPAAVNAAPGPSHPVMERQASTSSVSRSMDGLMVDSSLSRPPAAQSSSACSPSNQLPTPSASSQTRLVAMSDSPPLPAHSGLTAASSKAQAQASIIHEVSSHPPPRAPYPPPYITDYFPYSYLPHFCPPPPPPPAFAHLHYTRAPLLYPPPPPPPQLSQIVGAGGGVGGGGLVAPHSLHHLHPHHVLLPFHGQSGLAGSAPHQHHSPHSHAHAHHSQQLHAAHTPIVGSVM